MAKFYHRTTEENWSKIQEDGVLWGYGENYRYTYLSPDDFGESYGSVLLEVEYEPVGVRTRDDELYGVDNYGFDPPDGEYCWQFSVFVPIPIENVRRVL